MQFDTTLNTTKVNFPKQFSKLKSSSTLKKLPKKEPMIDIEEKARRICLSKTKAPLENFIPSHFALACSIDFHS